MAQIKADTTKMINCGNEIMQLSIEIGQDINTLFTRLQKMPFSTGEWTGKAAQAFATNLNKEKIQYVQLKNSLYDIGKYLVEGGRELENELRRM